MSLHAGAAEINITPDDSQFLYGYPHVKRYSTGVHDQLLCSALVVESDGVYAVFVTADIIFVDKAMVASARRRIAEASSIPPDSVLISATHTHSGPITVDYLSNESDPVVPKADRKYLAKLEDSIVEAVIEAFGKLQPAKAGLAVADATGVGTNRRSPDGPSDLAVPVLYVESAASSEPLACMVVCSMHPTALHEDSTEITADFPGFARAYIKREKIGESTPFLYYTGPAGNQSPRHVTKENTFAEAQRLGEIVGRSVVAVFPSISLREDLPVVVRSKGTELPPRRFPPVAEAEAALSRAFETLTELRNSDATPQEVRTAEVDWFGAEETLTLAKADADGRVAVTAQACMPAEVMAISIGSWHFVGLPGEIFVEYALEIKRRCSDTFVISLANGELQGYIVTAEAAEAGGYEASNALFEHSSGSIMVDIAAELLGCP